MPEDSVDLPEWLSFDCYGTLVDWETGILTSVRSAEGGSAATDTAILEAYARCEAALEAGPWHPYSWVLAHAGECVGRDIGADPRLTGEALRAGIAAWPIFPDTVESLQRLQRWFRLAIISNTDTAIFARTATALGVCFDSVTTAEDARAYKPDEAIFRLAAERMGARPAEIVHCGQSHYHDIAPANQLGLRSAWVMRRAARLRHGATLPAGGQPTWTVENLSALADLFAGQAEASGRPVIRR